VKIHIVQKGDTLWKIAQKYGVDFQELKQMNSHLSNPDMLMPGMKIKVPTGNVHVKKEAPMSPVKESVKKEAQVSPIKEAPITEHPFKEMPQAPLPVMDVQEEKPTPPPPKPPKPYLPKMPKLPKIPVDIDINNYNVDMNMVDFDMIHMPQAPQVLPEIEEEDQVAGVQEELPEMPQVPQMPPMMKGHMPCPPPMPMHKCVPMTPVMPGAGFNWCPPLTGPVGGAYGGVPGQMPFGAPGMNPAYDYDDDIDLPPNQPTNVAPAMMPPQYPANPYSQGFPMPNPGMGMVSPEMAVDDGAGMAPLMPLPAQNPMGFQGPLPPYQAPIAPFQQAPMQMPPNVYNQKDCGCGGPKPPHLGYQPMPQQGFPGVPTQPLGYPQPMAQGYPGVPAAQPFPAVPGMPPAPQGYPGVGMYGQPPMQPGVPFNPMFDMPDFDDNLDDD